MKKFSLPHSVALVSGGATIQQSSFYGLTSGLPSRYTQVIIIFAIIFIIMSIIIVIIIVVIIVIIIITIVVIIITFLIIITRQ